MGLSALMRKSNEHKNNVSKKSKVFLLILVIIFNIAGLFLFEAFFTSINLLEDIVLSSSFWSKIFSLVLNSYSSLVFIVAIAIYVSLFFTFFIFNESLLFPSRITIISIGFSSAVCLLVNAVVYIFYHFSISTGIQVLNVFPIVTTVISSVLLNSDLMDFYQGLYNPHNSILSLPVKELIDKTFNLFYTHEQTLQYNKSIANSDDFDLSYDLNILNDGNEHKTDHGFFSHEALETAAQHMVSNLDRASFKQKPKNNNPKT